MGNRLIVTILFSVIVLGNCGQRIDIVLSGRDIKKMNWWTESDPYVNVFYKFESSQNWIRYGQTSVANNNKNPNWPEVFTFDFVAESEQMVKYELWNSNYFFDDFIGKLELRLGEIVHSAIEGGGMAVERFLVPSDFGRILMKVRIDGTIPYSPLFDVDYVPGQTQVSPLSKLLLNSKPR